MKRYDKYTPTKVEWLPELPGGWESKKLKHCFNFSVGGTPTTSKESYFEGENTWVTIADMNQRVITESKNGLSDEGIAAAGMTVIPEGSLLYSFKLSVGKVAFAGKNLFTNEAIFSVLPNPDYDLTYFYFALPELLMHSAGQNIYGAKIFNQELLKNAVIALPPLPEQRAIAAFLDLKTAQLDQLVAQKQQMLRLLQEERAALINQAVTQGLDAAAPRRHSGIEWLGEVPAHWEVKRLKFVLKQPLKYGANEAAELQDTTLPRYIRITDFGDDGILKEDTFRSLPEEIAADYLLEDGDILFARSGATVGKTFQLRNYTGKACFAGYLIKATADENEVLADFLYAYTKSGGYNSWKESIFIQATIQNIGADKYSSLPVPVPPLDEQHKILDFLNGHGHKTTLAIDVINQEITLLQEYRAALIAEAVTGQIDVRDYKLATA